MTDDSKPRFTRNQIKAMSPEERARRIDELNEALADGRIDTRTSGQSPAKEETR